MKVISPFGPKIAKLKFSKKLIKKINNEVDQILNKKSLLKKLDYSKKLVGQVKQEFQLPKSFVKKNLEKVTNKVYFDIDIDGMHGPNSTYDELNSIFIPKTSGGILEKTNVVDFCIWGSTRCFCNSLFRR